MSAPTTQQVVLGTDGRVYLLAYPSQNAAAHPEHQQCLVPIVTPLTPLPFQPFIFPQQQQQQAQQQAQAQANQAQQQFLQQQPPPYQQHHQQQQHQQQAQLQQQHVQPQYQQQQQQQPYAQPFPFQFPGMGGVNQVGQVAAAAATNSNANAMPFGIPATPNHHQPQQYQQQQQQQPNLQQQQQQPNLQQQQTLIQGSTDAQSVASQQPSQGMNDNSNNPRNDTVSREVTDNPTGVAPTSNTSNSMDNSVAATETTNPPMANESMAQIIPFLTGYFNNLQGFSMSPDVISSLLTAAMQQQQQQPPEQPQQQEQQQELPTNNVAMMQTPVSNHTATNSMSQNGIDTSMQQQQVINALGAVGQPYGQQQQQQQQLYQQNPFQNNTHSNANTIDLTAMNNGQTTHSQSSSNHSNSSQSIGSTASNGNSVSAKEIDDPMENDEEGQQQPQTPKRSISLFLQCDTDHLSRYQCMVRKQIQLFEASPSDVDNSKQGRNKPIMLGQAGIQCKHCAMIPPSERKAGSVYFPTKLSGIYQTAQNMAVGHLLIRCEHIPLQTRQELKLLGQQKSSAGGGPAYWSDSAQVLGVCEVPGQGLRLKNHQSS